MDIVYRKQSKFTDALREYEEALRIEMATEGKNHPDVATTRSRSKQKQAEASRSKQKQAEAS